MFPAEQLCSNVAIHDVQSVGEHGIETRGPPSTSTASSRSRTSWTRGGRTGEGGAPTTEAVEVDKHRSTWAAFEPIIILNSAGV
jgi:hypothetical protein